MLDKKKFAEVLLSFCDMLGRPPLSKNTLSMYYRAVQDMDTDAFTARATQIIRERKYTTMPTPADFLEGTTETLEDRCALIADEVLRHMERLGADRDVAFPDEALMAAIDRLGGWVALCEHVSSFPADKLGIWKRDFAATYKACARRGEKGPRVLLGRHSRDNMAAGYLSEAGELKNGRGEIVAVMEWAPKQIGEGGGTDA